MRLGDVVEALEELVPLRLAEDWDNVGLLLGEPSADVERVLFCVDLTRAVLAEAIGRDCELIVAYHPPIFEPLRRLGHDALPFQLARHGIACWSPHSALDAADGGTSDVLAGALGLQDALPLRAATAGGECKLVTFVPGEHVEAVAQALFEAGAGVIGKYHSCSFRTEGTGTFFGGEGTNPQAGRSGRLESVAEIRLETIVPPGRMGDVVAALRRAHPYEEPAFDLVSLQARPEAHGLGRIGRLERPAPLAEVLDRVRGALGLTGLLVAGSGDEDIESAACAPGSCGDLWKEARARGATLYLTGELRHHDALEAVRRGLIVACTLHSNSERAALSPLAERLLSRLPGLSCLISREDADPFRFA